MKLFSLIAISIVSGLSLLHALSIGQNIQSVFIIFAIALLFLAKDDQNSQYLVIVFLSYFAFAKLVIFLLETYIYPNYNGLIQNTFAFGSALIEDLLLIYFIRNRMEMSLLFTKGKSPKVLEKNYADGPLLGLLIGYVAIDLLALIENVIRNLDKLGISEDFAKQFWDVMFFYNNYEYIKVVLISLTIAVLYMGVIIRKRQSLSAA